MSLLTEEQERMQKLAGIISENHNTEEFLSENLWDRLVNKVRGAAISIKGAITGKEEKSAVFKHAIEEMGYSVGKWLYGKDGGRIFRLKIKSIDYKTADDANRLSVYSTLIGNLDGIDIVSEEKGITGKWVSTMDGDKLASNWGSEARKLNGAKNQEETKEWYKNMVSNNNIADLIEKGEVTYSEEDLPKAQESPAPLKAAAE
jgi:hypothetical protein